MSDNNGAHNGWDKWSRHVIAELGRLNDCYEKLDDKLDKLSINVAMLNVKAGMVGGITGLIVAGVTLWIKGYMVK